MNIKSTAIAFTIVAASAVSSPVLAQDSQVQQVLNKMVSQALNVASQEIDNTIEKSVISAGHILTLKTGLPKSKVIVTDIMKVEETKETKDRKDTKATEKK
jgi:hypothetical protein